MAKTKEIKFEKVVKRDVNVGIILLLITYSLVFFLFGAAFHNYDPQIQGLFKFIWAFCMTIVLFVSIGYYFSAEKYYRRIK